jgi:phosphocarrier protein HPr
MWDSVSSRKVIVHNPQGLHARPADLFAKQANRFQAAIDVIKEGQHANGKSILDLLMLAAEEGTTLTIVARGEDAEEAIETLSQLMDQMVSLERAEGSEPQ